MWIIISFVLLAVVFYQYYGFKQLRQTLGDLRESLRDKRLFLMEDHSPWIKRYKLDQLNQQINDLVEDNLKISQHEIGYLRQTETTLNHLSEAVLVIDSGRRLVFANPAAQTLFLNGAEVDNQKIEGIIRSAEFLELMGLTMEAGAPTYQEIRIIKNNDLNYFEVKGALIPKLSDSESDLFLFVLHDITRLKELEGVRKEFVANVSHELRTPVTIIKGFADALSEDFETLPAETRTRFLSKIGNNVNRLHLLLEDLLSLSRLERDKDLLNLEECSLHALIHEVVEEVSPKLDAATQRIEIDFKAKRERLNLDKIKICQVIRNIIDNSLRYAKSFSVIRIEVDVIDSMIQVAISDDGCGIPEKDVSHIFERFYRVDKGRSRELGGTGLGLSIVKHIVQIHGGEISAMSELGEGLTIRFSLPLEKEITL